MHSKPICLLLFAALLIVPSSCKRNSEGQTDAPAHADVQQPAIAMQPLESTDTPSTPKPVNPETTPDNKPTTAIDTADINAPMTPCTAKPVGCDDSWVCLDRVWTCAQPTGCTCSNKKYPAGTTIQNSKVLCGKSESPEYIDDYICQNGLMVCNADKCSCGKATITRLDACMNGIAAFYNRCSPKHTRCTNPETDEKKVWCGTTAFSDIILKDDNSDLQFSLDFYKDYYTCENDHWICHNGIGCACGQLTRQDNGAKEFQACDDGKVVEMPAHTQIKYHAPKLEKVTPCTKGNCKCGDGACAKGANCIDGTCYCGDTNSVLYAYRKDIGVTLITGNDFGEFSCQNAHDEGTSAGDSTAYYYCDKPKGCTTTISKITIPAKYCIDAHGHYSDSELAPECKELGHIQFPDCSTLEATSQGPEDFNRQDLLRLCGRESAEKIKKRTKISDKFIQLFDHSEGESSLFYVFPRDSKDIQFACAVREHCDTWPVPRANRDEYVCDIGIETGSFIQYDSYQSSPIGLRCTKPDGCVCNASTCPNHAICTTDGCYYDSQYIRTTCGISPYMQSEAQIIADAKDHDAIEDALSKDGYGLTRFPQNYLEALNYTSGISVTADGACVCANSVLTSPDLKIYTCDLNGYRCTSPQGCACGSATCAHNAWCLRPNLCTK